jgi:hypothetical protein
MRQFLVLVLCVFLVAIAVLLTTAFRMIRIDEEADECVGKLMPTSGLLAAACVFVLVACRTVVDLRRAASVRNDDAPGSNR